MSDFKKSKVFFESDSVAEQLRSARQLQSLKLEDVSRRLKIKYDYLRALETGNYNLLPVGVYGKNFLREYAQFLGLDWQKMLVSYDNEIMISSRSQQEIFSKQVVKRRDLLAIPRLLRTSAILVAVILCFAYFNFYLKKLTALPSLSLDNPIENLVTDSRVVEVIGSTDPEVKVLINGEMVLADSDGMFHKTVNLKSGINVITVTAEKKFGKSSQVTRQILVKDDPKLQY